VRCGGEEFEMHASVVTCSSEYFVMLEHAMAKSRSQAFEIHEVQRRVLELGKFSGVAEGQALLEGSRFLRAERLEAQWSACLCAHVEASNCVAVGAEASRLGCGLVAERALASVAGEAAFVGPAWEPLVELVRSDELRSERAVYEAVLGWVVLRYCCCTRLIVSFCHLNCPSSFSCPYSVVKVAY
jgi:hypothetical protein